MCPLGGNSGNSLSRIYTLYMSTHPKLSMDAPKNVGLYEALRDAYPCPAHP